LFLFTCLSYYIFSQFSFFGNTVQLFLLNVTKTNALSALFYLHTMYIYIYIYIYIFIFIRVVLCCMCMTISISLDQWNVKINYNYTYWIHKTILSTVYALENTLHSLEMSVNTGQELSKLKLMDHNNRLLLLVECALVIVC
jgi:hypothetical protein